jgi:urease accessory protein
MFTAERFAEGGTGVAEALPLAYEERKRSRFMARLPSGDSLFVQLPPGTVLRDGDKLHASDGENLRIVEIRAAEENLAQVHESDVLKLARAAYHLGNRHVVLELGGDGGGFYLRFPPDHVLEDMLICRGYTVTMVLAPFQPEGGAYGGHSHGHGATSDKPSATIHEFR